MRFFFLLLILFSATGAKADYSGIHLEVSIQLLNGEELHGFKFIAQGQKTEAYQNHLELSPKVLLKNDYTFEPGNYGLYKNRLDYTPAENDIIYKLISPFEINIKSVKSVRILAMVMDSYATQINGDYGLEDQAWMRTQPIAKYEYTTGEGMCLHEIYIHKSDSIPLGTIKEIRKIIFDAKEKIKTRVGNNEENINTDEDYDRLIEDIETERNQLLQPFFEKYKSLKTLVVTTCTC